MKKLLGLLAVASFILMGCSQLEVKVAENLKLEYGEELDNSKLFDAAASDEKVEVQKVDGFDNKKLGDQTIKVTFTDGDRSTEKEIKVTVEDTKKPEIVLNKDTVTITAGDKLELKDNIKSVKDPVDGDLKYSDKKIEKAGYYFESNIDTAKAGTYEVKVLAYDANGNVAEKTFKVVVEKKEETNKQSNGTASNNNSYAGSVNNKPVAQQPSTPSSNGSTANTGNSSSNVLCPNGWFPEKACNIPISDPSIGSDGVYYNSVDEADAAGTKYIESQNKYGYDVYSVDFNDRTKKYIWISHEDLGIY